MGVDVGRGAHLGVSQTLRDGNAVHAVEVEHGGHRVTKIVRVDVRQAVARAELSQPVGHTVRVHGLSGLLSEDKSLVLVVVLQMCPHLVLPRPVL